jgi:hypothetical protein
MAYDEGVRFALSLDVCEDYEATGCYSYEPVVDAGLPWASAWRPLTTRDCRCMTSTASSISATPLKRATCARSSVAVLPDVAEGLKYLEGPLYSIYLLETGTAKRAMTLESPRSRPWDDRIATHRVAVTTTLTALSDRLDRDDTGTDV